MDLHSKKNLNVRVVVSRADLRCICAKREKGGERLARELAGCCGFRVSLKRLNPYL